MKNCIYNVMSFIGLFILLPSQALSIGVPSGIYSPGSGIIWSDSVNDSYSSPTGWFYSTIVDQSCFFFNIRYSNGDAFNSSSNTFTSSDGKYTGLKIAEDIIFVVNNANVNVSGGGGASGGANFDINGNTIATGSGIIQKLPNTYCVTAPANNTLPNKINAGRKISFNGNVAIYVGPNAAFGTYNVPAVFAGLYTEPGVPLSAAGSITIKNVLECSISAPPTIDFGQVDGKGDGWVPVANRDSILKIDCSSELAGLKKSANVSFTAGPLYYNRSELLEMTTDGSYGVGILNGRYGQGNISSCSASNTNSPDAVKFNGTVSKTLELNIGTNEIPITWTLCRRGDTVRYGNTSAQATVNVNWN